MPTQAQEFRRFRRHPAWPRFLPHSPHIGNPYMTPEQGDECHAGGWNDAEIATFTARATRFAWPAAPMPSTWPSG